MLSSPRERAILGLERGELLCRRGTSVVLGHDRRIGVGHYGQLAIGPPVLDALLADDALATTWARSATCGSTREGIIESLVLSERLEAPASLLGAGSYAAIFGSR
jgi:hypothetical protein